MILIVISYVIKSVKYNGEFTNWNNVNGVNMPISLSV